MNAPKNTLKTINGDDLKIINDTNNSSSDSIYK